MKAARSPTGPNGRRRQCAEAKRPNGRARRLSANQLNLGITLVQNRSIDFISFACGTSAL